MLKDSETPENIEENIILEDTLEEATEPTPTKHESHYIRQETITVTQPHNDTEKLEYGKEMAESLKQINSLELELDMVRKDYKRQIEALEKTAQSAGKIYLEGTEEREVHCDLIADFTTKEMVWTDSNPPHDVMSRRPMTAEEKKMQLPLPIDRPSKAEASEPSESDVITGEAGAFYLALEAAEEASFEKDEDIQDAEFTDVTAAEQNDVKLH